MELLLNDLSIHGQFHDAAEFREAVIRILSMRSIAKRFNRELHCHGNVVSCQVTREMSMNQVIQTFPREEQSALRNWLTKHGPFWDEMRLHGPDDYLECNTEIVTDTAVGEAAYCSIAGIDRRLVSIIPSQWEYSPITVTVGTDTPTSLEVANYWAPSELEADLQGAEPPIMSWSQLEAASRTKFQCLQFSRECFRPLDGQPFVHGAAERIINRLDILNRLMESVDASGNRTEEGDQLYRDHLDRGNDRFSDSSGQEKIDFKQELTFPHPGANGRFLFCPWHGKVNKRPPFRIHFSWPVAAGEPLYVVYVGLKITRR